MTSSDGQAMAPLECTLTATLPPMSTKPVDCRSIRWWTKAPQGEHGDGRAAAL